MELKTGDFMRLCRMLNISREDLKEIDQPSEHMRMAEAVYNELSLLDFDQAKQLVNNNDNEIVVRASRYLTLLVLRPNKKLVPGNGLPTIDEQKQKMRHEMEQARKARKLDKIRTDTFDVRDNISKINKDDISNLRDLSSQIVNVRNELNNFNDSIKSDKRNHMHDELEWLSLLTKKLLTDINKIMEEK